MHTASKKFWIETYGCQMNFAESAALEIELMKQGFIQAAHEEEADIIILNTCSVRETAENRIWGRLGRLQHIRKNRDFQLILTGCMAERISLQSDRRKELNHVDAVIGTNGKNHIADFLSRHESIRELAGQEQPETYEFTKCHVQPGEFKALIPIMNGCSNFCTYCIVPYVRGKEISRKPEDIFTEIEYLEEQGIKEITLLGQNVNSYHVHWKGKRYSFADLLDDIVQKVDGIKWIRYLSPHPKNFQKQLIQLTEENDVLCSHVHLPVQHGSDSVLHAMNRKYTVQSYLEIVEAFRKQVPSMTFSTDLLIGFPGETEKDLEDTFQLMKDVRFIDAFTYFYNPRKGTKAERMPDQIEDSVKHERLKRVIELQKEISHEEKMRRIGSAEQVLVESVSKKNDNELLARTEHDDMVILPKSGLSITGKKSGEAAAGEMHTALLREMHGNTFIGSIVR